MAAYLAARTWFFDQAVVDAIDRGVTQIVIAAAGYDTRALRYAKDGVRWFELDHPVTQTDKRARVEELGTDTSQITFVSADFTVDDVARRLTDAGCDPSASSLVMAEGISAYLSLPVLADLLGALRRTVAVGSRLAMSVSMTAETDEEKRRRAAFQERVAAVGEPALSVLTAADSEQLLIDAGWRLEAPLVEAPGAPGRTGLVTATAV
jgi:methyltransferase (TIGR00027 family)